MTTILQQYVVPRLGDGEYKTVSVENILKWHAKLQEVRRSTPKLDAELLILQHAMSGEVLDTLSITFEGFPETVYPADLNLTSETPVNVRRRRDWHDLWMRNVLNVVASDKTSALIKAIREVKLKSTGPSGGTRLADVMEFTRRISEIFTRDPDAEDRANAKEIYQAVRSGILPVQLRNVVDSKKPTDPDVKDTWRAMVSRLSQTVKTVEDNLAEISAVEGVVNKIQKPPTEIVPKIPKKGVLVSETPMISIQELARRARWQKSRDRRAAAYAQSAEGQEKKRKFEAREAAEKEAAKANITCFKCQQKGHYANECPNEAVAPPTGLAKGAGGRGGGKGAKGKRGRGG